MLAEENVRPLRVHHLAVKVRDLARAETFYAGALGLPVVRRQDDETGAPRSTWVSLGEGAFLALERAEAAEPLRDDGSPGWHCVALGIDPAEREAWRARLTASGHPVVRETAYTLYVRDPDGAIVALSHYPHAVAEAVLAGGGDPAPGGAGEGPSTAPVEVGPDGSAAAPASPSGVTSRLAALVTLSLALLALLFGAPTASAQRRPPADVLVIGSSSVFGPFGRLIEERLEAVGLRVSRYSHRSTGFARPDFFDWQRELRRLRGLSRARGVVVMMGGNDTMALRLRREERQRGEGSWVSWRDEARWRALYSQRVRTFVETICDAGVARAIVVLPADGDREGWADRIGRVQEAMAEGVRGTRCGVVLDPRTDAPVRPGDTLDGVHLSTTGAQAVLTRIGPALVAAIRS